MEGKVEYKLTESIGWHGTRYKSGTQMIPVMMAVSLEMLSGKTREDAKKEVEKLLKEQNPTSEEQAPDNEELDESKKEEQESDQADEEPDGTPLPDDFPHKNYFEKEGVDTLEKVYALETLTSVNGISENRAIDVEDFLKTLSDSEG